MSGERNNSGLIADHCGTASSGWEAADASWPTQSWPRLGAAQSWLDAKKPSADGSLETFKASAKSDVLT